MVGLRPAVCAAAFVFTVAAEGGGIKNGVSGDEDSDVVADQDLMLHTSQRQCSTSGF